jgi:hypothetical protein
MAQCLIYDNRALNFFRATCGFLALFAYLIQNEWIVLITGILFFLGVFSMKFNILYQLFNLVSGKILKQKIAPVQKDSGELKFVYGFTGICFLIAFAMIYFKIFPEIGWFLNLAVSFLTLLASFTNICLAALMYVVYRKIFNR